MQSITLLLENETYKHWGAALCHAKKAMMVDEALPWSWKQQLFQIASGSISILHGCQHVLRDDLFSRNLQILSRSTYHGLFDLFTQSKALPKLGWHKGIICPVLCFSQCRNVKTFWFGYETAMQDPTTCFCFLLNHMHARLFPFDYLSTTIACAWVTYMTYIDLPGHRCVQACKKSRDRCCDCGACQARQQIL